LNKILFFFFSTGLLGCALAPVKESPEEALAIGTPFCEESIAKAKELELRTTSRSVEAV
jgi:hypothetical protein